MNVGHAHHLVVASLRRRQIGNRSTKLVAERAERRIVGLLNQTLHRHLWLRQQLAAPVDDDSYDRRAVEHHALSALEGGAAERAKLFAVGDEAAEIGRAHV